MHSIILKIEKIARNPFVEITVGIVLLLTGLAEAGETIFEDITSGDVGTHHGIIVLGFAHALKAVPPILSSLLLFTDGNREIH